MAKVPIDALLDKVAWVALDDASRTPDADGPYATHEGWFELVPGLTMHVYQLNTGQRALDEASVQRLFQWLAGSEDTHAGS
jgi:hypothetical protein